MFYSSDEVLQYVRENDVKFIRLAFCDICGTLKNIAIMPSQLERALDEGITLDPRALRGFQAAGGYDLLLKPDPSTLTAMPWRPQQGRVVRLMSSLMTTNGEPFVLDTREILRRTVREAIKPGYTFRIGTECEFYLFRDGRKRQTHPHAAGQRHLLRHSAGRKGRKRAPRDMPYIGRNGHKPGKLAPRGRAGSERG